MRSRPEEFAVTILEDPIPTKKLTIADLQDPAFDLSQYNDIDPSLIQYAIDHFGEPHTEEILDVLQRSVRGDHYQFASVSHLSDPAMARMAVEVGMTVGEGGVERPWAMFYAGEVQTVEAARELVKFAGICPHYFTLTQEPTQDVAQELGKARPAFLTLDFIPSRETMIALHPIEHIVLQAPIQNAQQVEPLVEWLSESKDHELHIRGGVPEDVKEALIKRFPYDVDAY
jgi:hypothetical protein